MPIDPGPPPQLGGDAGDGPGLQGPGGRGHPAAAACSTPSSDATIDISPASLGDNTLGTNDGHGPPASTRRPDSRTRRTSSRSGTSPRALAEFWADGPKSETPPGHWNVIANDVSDELGADNLKIGGQGAPVDRLQWDVKLYLALNGAVHDAAIAAWGLKGHYDSVRPISMIRYIAGLGPVERSVAPVVQRRGHPARARPRRAHHAGDDGRRAAPRGCSRATRARSRSAPGRATRGPEDADERRRLDPRRHLGAVPAADLRDARRSRASRPATARSAARPPRS